MKKWPSYAIGVRCLVLAAALIAGGYGGAAFAQSTNSSLRGSAPANAVVTAKNTATGLVRSTKVSASGDYTLVGLPPGTYQVDAGPGTQQTVSLEIASNATLDLIEEKLEIVVVTGKRLVEVKTSEIGTNISLHQIETTPQITRNFLEFADAVPGMYFQVDASGNTSIHSGTLGNGATNVYIDGVGQKNYVRSSGVSGQAGSSNDQNTVGDPGNPFPQLAIGEYKVITSNYKAEYDQISGAAITAVTKSGTNKFEAEVFGDFSNAGLRAPTPVEIAGGKGKQGGPSYEYGFSVAGPIITDVLHYFATYEGKQFTTPNSVFPQQIQDANRNNINYLPWLPASLLSNYGPVSNPFKEGLYFGKLDWEPTDADRFETSLRYRRERQQAGASGQTAESAASLYTNDENRMQVKWDHAHGSLLNEAIVAYEKTNDTPSKASNNPGLQYVLEPGLTANNGFDVLLQINGVDPRSYFITRQKGVLFQDDLTFSALPWLGDHTVKVGVKFKSVQLDDQDSATAPQYSYFVNSAGVEANPLQVTFGAQSINNLPTVATSKNKQFGVYFQDDWAINRHLLLNVGVRYDYEQTPTYTDYVTPQRFVDALFNTPYVLTTANGVDAMGNELSTFGNTGRNLNTTPGETYAKALALSGINLSDYISNGHNRKNPKNEIQPRLGFSYDINEDQRHVVFGGAGRAYDRNVFGILQHESNKAALTVPTVQFFDSFNGGCPADGSKQTPTCIAWNNAYYTTAGLQSIAPASYGEMHLMPNNLKVPYSDQFSIGMRNRLGIWDTSVTLARINAHDGLQGFSGDRFGDGSWQVWDAAGNYNYIGYVSPGAPNGVGYLYLFNNGKESRNTQLLISASKPYTKESGWSTTIAYTYSDAFDKLTFNGDYQFDYPNNNLAPFVPSDRLARHRLVVVGSVDGPWGLNFGGKLVVETPKPLTSFDGTNPKAVSDGTNYFQYFKEAQTPRNAFGYRSVDMQITKTIEAEKFGFLQVRLDVLNMFDFHTYSQFTDHYPLLPTYYTNGNITGVPFTMKLTLDYKW